MEGGKPKNLETVQCISNFEMFWSTDQNKQLSNQCVNLESREVRPIKLLIVFRHYLTVDQVITDQYWIATTNRPVYIYYWPGLNACRKTRIALTSPSRSCDANFISLLVAARVISPDSSLSCLVCDYYYMLTFVKTALWSQLSIFLLLLQSRSKACKWKEMSSNIL